MPVHDERDRKTLEEISEEIFDVCDARDRVIGQAARSVVHRDKLLHRAVHVFVFNTQHQLLVQLRSTTKDEFPLSYTSSASGHLSTGETYIESAERELKEEIGLVAPLEFLAKFPASEDFAWEHTVLYRAHSDIEPQPDPIEVAQILRFTIPELMQHLKDDPAKFSPPFRKLVEWYASAFVA